MFLTDLQYCKEQIGLLPVPAHVRLGSESLCLSVDLGQIRFCGHIVEKVRMRVLPARRPPHRSCPPEISKRAWVVSQPSRAVGPIMHRIGESEREEGRGERGDRLHLGVERDIAESDIVHLGLPPSLPGRLHCSSRLLSVPQVWNPRSLSFDTDNEPCPIRPIFILLPRSDSDSKRTFDTGGKSVSALSTISMEVAA